MLGYYFYVPPGGSATISWFDTRGNSLTVGVEKLFTGTQETGGNASLEFGLTDPNLGNFVSGNGTCSVTLTAVEEHRFAGRFACAGVKSPTGGTLTVAGDFSAKLNAGV